METVQSADELSDWENTLNHPFQPQLSRLAMRDDEADVRCWMHRDELRTARDIQFQLLPNHIPQPPGFRIEARSTPALEVGGDHYNFHTVGGGALGVVIADVSGKGLPAALVAAMLASTLRVQTWGNHNVRDLLMRVNDFITHALRPGMFVTCTYGLLDSAKRTFTFARAGHEPLLLLRASGAIETHAPAGFALGMLGGGEFKHLTEVQTLHLNAGDRLLLFTDGLTEAMNAQGEEFGMERILKTLEVSRRAPRLLSAIEREVLVHCGAAPPHDDRTLLVLSAE